jgi:hypothetical protein
VNDPIPITPLLGNIYIKHSPQNVDTRPVTSDDDLHSDDGSGLHDILSSQKAKAILHVSSTWRAAYANLASLPEKSFDTWHILSTGIRLAKTKPLLILGWTDDELTSSLLAGAWVGGQETFGALWKIPTPGVTFSPQVETLQTDAKTSTVTPARPKASPRPYLYATRTKKAPPARKAIKPQYSKNTFLHLTIPIAVQGVKGFATAEEEISRPSTKFGR